MDTFDIDTHCAARRALCTALETFDASNTQTSQEDTEAVRLARAVYVQSLLAEVSKLLTSGAM